MLNAPYKDLCDLRTPSGWHSGRVGVTTVLAELVFQWHPSCEQPVRVMSLTVLRHLQRMTSVNIGIVGVGCYLTDPTTGSYSDGRDRTCIT